MRHIIPIRLIKLIRSGRKIRLITVLAIIAIITTLVANTILTRQKVVRADSFFKLNEGYGTINALIF